MSDMDDLFAQIGGSQASNKGNYFEGGKGTAVIREVIAKKGNEGRMVIAAVDVISAESNGLTDKETGKPLPVPAAGAAISWPQLIDKFKSSAGNVKSFVLNLTGFKEADVSSADFAKTLAQLASKEQPARGMLIRFDTYQQQTKSGANAGKWRTYVKWAHVKLEEGNDRESVKARREGLDKTSPIL